MNAARKLSEISLPLVSGWIRRPGIIFVALSLSLLIPIATVVVLGPRQSPDVTLVVVEGEVTVANIASGEERAIPVGEAIIVQTGEEIRVAEDSMAQLTFFDGATTDLFAGTELQLAQFQVENDQYQVGLDLTIGKITTQIRRLLTAGESFEVITPSSAVTVRGTVFTVEVFPDRSTEVSCEEGVVTVTKDGQQLELYPGDSMLIEAGQADSTEEVTPPPAQAVQVTATPTPTVSSLDTSTEILPPTNPQSTLLPATAVSSDVEVTSQIESVWYCTALGGGSYEWYEVELIFRDGQKVEERILSGPYTGGWQPNCPGEAAAPIDNTSAGDDSGSSGGSDGGGGSDCLVNPDC